jgi:hypothetical protein
MSPRTERDARPRFDPEVIELAEEAIHLDQMADRALALDLLVEDAGSRERLEAVRDYFVHRLHKSSFDYDASRGLRLVIAALPRAWSEPGRS